MSGSQSAEKKAPNTESYLGEVDGKKYFAVVRETSKGNRWFIYEQDGDDKTTRQVRHFNGASHKYLRGGKNANEGAIPSFDVFAGKARTSGSPQAKEAVEEFEKADPLPDGELETLQGDGREVANDQSEAIKRIRRQITATQAIINAYAADALQDGEDALTTFKQDLQALRSGTEEEQARARYRFESLGIDPDDISPEVITKVSNELYNDLGAFEKHTEEVYDESRKRDDAADSALGRYLNRDREKLDLMTGLGDESADFESGMPYFPTEPTEPQESKDSDGNSGSGWFSGLFGGGEGEEQPQQENSDPDSSNTNPYPPQTRPQTNSQLGYLQEMYDSLTPEQKRNASLDDLSEMNLNKEGQNVAEVAGKQQDEYRKAIDLDNPHYYDMLGRGGLYAPERPQTRDEYLGECGGFSSKSANDFARKNLSVNGMSDREGYGSNYSSLYNRDLDEAIDRRYQQQLQAAGVNQAGAGIHTGLIDKELGAAEKPSEWHTTHKLPWDRHREEKSQHEFDNSIRTGQEARSEAEQRRGAMTDLYRERRLARKDTREIAKDVDKAILDLGKLGVENVRSMADLDVVLQNANLTRQDFVNNLILKWREEGRAEEAAELQNIILKAQGQPPGWFDKYGFPALMGLISGASQVASAAVGGKR